jgi:hypothetical protein
MASPENPNHGRPLERDVHTLSVCVLHGKPSDFHQEQPNTMCSSPTPEVRNRTDLVEVVFDERGCLPSIIALINSHFAVLDTATLIE